MTRSSSLRALPILWLLLGSAVHCRDSWAHQIVQGDSKHDLCAIAGTVVSAATGQPLRKAHVSLLAEDRRGSEALSAITDPAGHFSIEQIHPGRYTMSVERVGFVSQAYDQDRPDKPGGVLTLEPGKKMTDMLFRLRNAAVISGRIVDEDGEPAQDALVELLKRGYENGKAVAGPIQEAKANDLGEYRIYGLSPGRYYVRASNSAGFEAMLSGKEKAQALAGYAPTFYPGTTDPSQAGALNVKAGDEISGIDITLALNRTYHVRGHVSSMIGSTGSQVNVSLFPRAASMISSADMRGDQADPKTGAFDISQVPPGSYVLTALCSDDGKIRVATQDVDVQSANIDDISLVVTKGVDIPGRLTVEGKIDGGGTLTVVLSHRGEMLAIDSEASVKADGSFLFSDVGDGDYFVRVGSPCSECYVKSVRAGQVDALKQGIQISGGGAPASIDVVYSSRTATVTGVVSRDDGVPASGALVVVVPDEPFRKDADRYKTASTDQYGGFSIRGVAPGHYAAYAFERVEEGAYEDADFLKPFEKRAESLDLEESGSKALQLTLIPAVSDEP